MTHMSFAKLKVFAEHPNQMFFQTHHQRMHPIIKDYVGTFPTHLGGIPSGNILNVNRSRNDCARDAQTFGNMTFHLGAQN